MALRDHGVSGPGAAVRRCMDEGRRDVVITGQAT